MVMLTRLTENGTAMCHRYWPEEGSELYHIYEVKNFFKNNGVCLFVCLQQTVWLAAAHAGCGGKN
jgi:protein tyrosine phosphatase